MNKTKNTVKSATPAPRWAEGAVVYQVYPRSFYDSNADGIGDIPGVYKQLDYIKELGATVIWLSPFYPSPMADFGYDVADYCDVDPIFGKLSDMKKLLKGAHKRGIKIMVDLVCNHTSDEHEWFRQSRQSRENAHADWYVWKEPNGYDDAGNPVPPNNWINLFTGNTAWQWEPARQQFYLHSFDVRQPDLNWENPKVREAIKEAMRFWLDMGMDGFRVDAVVFMAKDPDYRDEPLEPNYVEGEWEKYNRLQHPYNHAAPLTFVYLHELASVLREEPYLASPRFMVTEAYPDNEPIEEYLTYYKAMDPDVAAPFIFEGMHLPREPKPWGHFLTKFHTALNDFNPNSVASYAFGNHDQPRIVSRLGLPAARGSAVLLLTLPGMAFVYNGDEIGMRNGVIPAKFVQDPSAVGGGGRDPERTPLQWSDAKNAGFSKAKQTWLPVNNDYPEVNVETESRDPLSMLSLYRSLTQLRASNPALNHGDIKVVASGNEHVLAYTRRHDDQAILVLINFGEHKARCEPQYYPEKLLVSSDPNTQLDKPLSGELTLLPNEAALFSLAS